MAAEKVLFNPFAVQWEFIEACFSGNYSFVLYSGAIRAGKTWAILGLFLLLCRAFPGSRWAIVREDLPQIRKLLLPSFNAIVPHKMAQSMPSASNMWTFTAVNGSQIIFISENYDQELKYLEDWKGLEIDGVGFEEMSGIRKETFQKALERIGTWRMAERAEKIRAGIEVAPAFVCGTTNPTSGWLKKDVYDLHKADKLPQRWRCITAGILDNPYIPDGFVEEKRQSMTSVNFQKYVQGDWEIIENDLPFLYEFKRSRNISDEPLTPNPKYPLYLCFDFNYSPTVCLVAQKITEKLHDGGGLFFYREHIVEGGTRPLCEKLQIYKNHPSGIKVVGDFSGHTRHTSALSTDYDIIKASLGISWNAFIDTDTANKDHIYSRELMNYAFFKLHILIDREGCPELIYDMEIAQVKDDGKLKKDRQVNKLDLLDGSRYFVDAIFPGGVPAVNKLHNLIT